MDAGTQIHRDVDLLGAIGHHLHQYFRHARVLDERLPLFRLHLPSITRLVTLEKHDHALQNRSLSSQLSYNMKRIVLIGAESTGKSTLAQLLSGYYKEPSTEEFVRSYVESHKAQLSASDLEPIAKGQLALEDAALENAQRLIIHDTNILSTIIYANIYFDTVLDWVNDRFLERDYSLYLLCMPDIPWEADEGQRESPEARDTLHQQFKHSLDRLTIPYVEINGTQDQRMLQAVHAIDTALATE